MTSSVEFPKSTRLALAGAGGLLGQAVYARFSAIADVMATDIHVNEPWLSHANVRDYAAIAKPIREFKPQVVMNLASLTDLEECAWHEENTRLTNAPR